MKRPTMLVEALLHQAALDLDLSVERDVVTLRRRCKHEGLSFLTITLPTLADSLQRGLETGLLSLPTSFSRCGRLPRFLGGFFSRVFDKEGRLRPEACPDSVYWIRQICFFFKKLKIGCSPEREALAAAHFLDVEGELNRGTPLIDREDLFLDKISGIVWSQVFPEIDSFALVCRHGPGATAERRRANERYGISHWNTRSELNFPSDLHCFPNYGLAAAGSAQGSTNGEQHTVTFLSVRDEIPVRVVFVPKTQLAPRVIAIEPSHVQYMQQALKDHVYAILENHRLTRQSIRFTRQDVNQQLAYSSSIDKRLATLDLKDASDRVHLGLVQRIFKTSGILEHLEDSRSLHATLPDGTNVVLSKFASMGSALCFPVEAMVFFTLIQTAMHRVDGRIPSSRSIEAYSRLIDIYGDDIIVPVEYADAVVDYLESYLLKVNVSKSFRLGNFRESCGADFFKGVAVNPVYARTVPLDSLRHWSAADVMSWNATADLFYLRGKWQIAQTIREMLVQVLNRTIPRSRVTGPGVAFASLLFTTHLVPDKHLCGWKQRRMTYTPIKIEDKINGNESACLQKWGIHGYLRDQGLPGLDNDVFSDRDRVASLLRDLSGSGAAERGPPASGSTLDAVQDLCVHMPGTGDDSPVPGCLDARGSNPCDECPEHEVYVSREPHWAPARRSSFFDLLAEEGTELDFDFSAKRGSFKSKCRWVSLLG